MLVQQITRSTPLIPAPAINSGAIPRVAASSLRRQLLMEWCMLVPGIAICMQLMLPQEPYYGASPPAIGLAPRQRLPAAWSIPVHRIICSPPWMPAPAINSGAIPRVAASSLRRQLLMEGCMLVLGIAICMQLMLPQEPYYGASPPAIGLAPRQRLPAAWSIPVHRIICSTP